MSQEGPDFKSSPNEPEDDVQQVEDKPEAKEEDTEEVKRSEDDEEDQDDDENVRDEDDPEIAEMKEEMLLEEAYAVGLDAVKYCRNENAKYGEESLLNSRLNMKVSTWMHCYDNMDEPDEYAVMKDVSIGIAEKLRGIKLGINEPGSFAAKYEATAPYHFFLTTVCDEPSTYEQPYSVSFREIIDHSMGVLEDSLHISFVVELSWLITEYMIACQTPKMAVVYGSCMDPDTILTIPFENIDLEETHLPGFGCIHSKISIFKYKDGNVRLVISTANLYAADWQNRTQGLWISPFLPPLPVDADDKDGESPTNFKRDFIEYLSEHKEPQVFGWMGLMHRIDFSAIKVFFVGSVPGEHKDSKLNSWGRNKLGKILSEHVVMPENAKEWPIVAQCSAVGSFGREYSSWLMYTLQSFSRQKDGRIVFLPEFKFIFPSQENYLGCYDDGLPGTALLYSKELHDKQTWIEQYLHQWRSDKTCRTFAMPHLKCYTRISPDGTEIPWFFLTSANFGKGAMGKTVYNKPCLIMNNFEAGVVFIPKILIDRDTFPISENTSSDVPLFLLPYDVPLTPYRQRDKPYFTPSQVPVHEEVPEEPIDVEEPNQQVTDDDSR